LNMYVAQVNNGKLNVVKSLGEVDPKECVQGVK
jgi:urea transport system substrate-binding protein